MPILKTSEELCGCLLLQYIKHVFWPRKPCAQVRLRLLNARLKIIKIQSQKGIQPSYSQNKPDSPQTSLKMENKWNEKQCCVWGAHAHASHGERNDKETGGERGLSSRIVKFYLNMNLNILRSPPPEKPNDLVQIVCANTQEVVTFTVCKIVYFWERT